MGIGDWNCHRRYSSAGDLVPNCQRVDSYRLYLARALRPVLKGGLRCCLFLARVWYRPCFPKTGCSGHECFEILNFSSRVINLCDKPRLAGCAFAFYSSASRCVEKLAGGNGVGLWNFLQRRNDSQYLNLSNLS